MLKIGFYALRIAKNGLLALQIVHFLFSMPVVYRLHPFHWHVLMRLRMLELSVGKGHQITPKVSWRYTSKTPPNCRSLLLNSQFRTMFYKVNHLYVLLLPSMIKDHQVTPKVSWRYTSKTPPNCRSLLLNSQFRTMFYKVNHLYVLLLPSTTNLLVNM